MPILTKTDYDNLFSLIGKNIYLPRVIKKYNKVFAPAPFEDYSKMETTLEKKVKIKKVSFVEIHEEVELCKLVCSDMSHYSYYAGMYFLNKEDAQQFLNEYSSTEEFFG